jgi:hypothetical protein
MGNDMGTVKDQKFHKSEVSDWHITVANLLAVSYYVAYRSYRPEEATVNEVHRVMQENYIDTSRMVEWPANHCQEPNSS